MKFLAITGFCLLMNLAGDSGIHSSSRDTGIHVIDFVDLPRSLTGTKAGTASDWYIEFREVWMITPGGPALQKNVEEIKLHNRLTPEGSQDSLRARFAAMLKNQPRTKGKVLLRDISYEFTLLDPHTPGSENRDFTGPAGMDQSTHKLQQELITLVKGRSAALGRSDLEELLFSFHFHETWSVDPVSLHITKKVLGITPVIWQRRKTTSGDPVNDAESGLPVYYKNRLDRIQLRNP